MILDRILVSKRQEVESRKLARPEREVRAAIADAPPARDFASALRRSHTGIPAVIAEVKKASPSRGILRSDFDPAAIAADYQAGGASAVSVLTDEQYFMGSLDYLFRVRTRVELPVLRKDFLIDPYQVYESRAAGADAVLLIAAALEKERLTELMDAASQLGMAALVEVHDEEELETALACGAGLLGINNRNLYTFDVDLGTTTSLAARLPPIGAPERPKLVSESGIFTRQDLEQLGRIGTDAVLIGEALVREKDIVRKLKELTA